RNARPRLARDGATIARNRICSLNWKHEQAKRAARTNDDRTSQSTAPRPARRQVGIAAHGQRLAPRSGLGRHTQETFEPVAMTFRTLHILALEHECFKRVLAILTSVFVHRHRSISLFSVSRTSALVDFTGPKEN